MPYIGVALPNETSTVGFTATLTNFTVDLGPQTLYYSFEYRPNPIIEDIYPRATILRYRIQFLPHILTIIYTEYYIYTVTIITLSIDLQYYYIIVICSIGIACYTS